MIRIRSFFTPFFLLQIFSAFLSFAHFLLRLNKDQLKISKVLVDVAEVGFIVSTTYLNYRFAKSSYESYKKIREIQTKKEFLLYAEAHRRAAGDAMGSEVFKGQKQV